MSNDILANSIELICKLEWWIFIEFLSTRASYQFEIIFISQSQNVGAHSVLYSFFIEDSFIHSLFTCLYFNLLFYLNLFCLFIYNLFSYLLVQLLFLLLLLLFNSIQDESFCTAVRNLSPLFRRLCLQYLTVFFCFLCV